MEEARQRAIELKDSLILKGQKNGWQQKEWKQEANAFLDYLSDDISDTETPEEEIYDEIFIIMRTVSKNGGPASIDLSTCSKEAFITQLVSDCIRSRSAAAILQCSKWVKFAGPYTKDVMAI